MKAIVIEEYGEPNVLREVEMATPQVEKGTVLVKLAATSINPIDWKIRKGYLQKMLPWSFPIILGFDLAGVITEVGEGVTQWSVGDRVAGRRATTPEGTYAEYATISEHDLALIPDEVSFDVAAATPLAGLTAWQSLHEIAHVRSGQRVLIHAGAGGVGQFAIQFAKLAGAYVITTASETNSTLLHRLGADEVIDYKQVDLTKAAQDIDVVLDAVGGETQLKSLSTLSETGARTLVTLGAITPETKEYAEEHNITAVSMFMNPNGEQLADIFELIREHKVDVTIAATLPFNESGLREAHHISETGHSAGKIVIQFE